MTRTLLAALAVSLLAACASQAERARRMAEHQCQQRYHEDLAAIERRHRQYADEAWQAAGRPETSTRLKGALDQLALSESYQKELAQARLQACLAEI